MEAVTKVIVDIKVKDKRETGGTSTVMEVAALKCHLERLVETMSIGNWAFFVLVFVLWFTFYLKVKQVY